MIFARLSSFDSTKDSCESQCSRNDTWLVRNSYQMQEGSRCKVFIPPHLAYGEMAHHQ